MRQQSFEHRGPARRTVSPVFFASLVWALSGCSSPPRAVVCTPHPPASAALGLTPDFTFVPLLLQYQREPTPQLAERVMEHPAFAAMQRHRAMAGNAGESRERFLELLSARKRDVAKTPQVLAYWQQRPELIAQRARAALPYLPSDVRVNGTLFFVINYESVTAPPDVIMDPSDDAFHDDALELGFMIPHEVHHVGFLQYRQWPGLQHIDEPAHLLALIRFATQLEGMAVHAVYNTRKQHQDLATLSGQFSRDYRS